ncbi:hypothetical protein EKL30_17370 [Candidimonas sp. SYP-B2681]|uniref:LolA family protein n=1 Tax=Candidimonas sp. SYP-B2681 TaxID=2497686 RepID=UPI000F85D73A|nr:sigma-E factor regulatory protein RseB domain-containing protein [Candidimonas sp. SYP-B2681]RTZ40023.1 hypothetical protein EKL30_17370 [Candidimonas sp. SYP-B2681]
MFGELLMVSLFLSGATDPLQSAVEHYRRVDSYQMKVQTSSGSSTDVMLYSFKKPGYVRVDFEKPFKGAVLIYDPTQKKAKLWPFGFQRLPVFTLDPDNRMIKSPSGQRIDRSDVGYLFENAKLLASRGSTERVGTQSIEGQNAIHLVIKGDGKFSLGEIHQYQLWLDSATGFPVRVASYNAGGRLLEQVEISGLLVDPEFPLGFFDL